MLEAVPENACRANHGVDLTEVNAHTIDGSVQLFEIANIGAEPQRVASAVLNFQVRRIDLRLTAGEQANPRAELGKSYCESLTKPAAGARDENIFTLKVRLQRWQL